ncbi:hypothetical protein MY11210_008854 [Beauveria gryllotalpidicola]
MRVNVATIGAVTLGSSVMAQSAPEWSLDACHKVDSAVEGFIWPCASQLKITNMLCPLSASTEEERIAQRDCLCGEGSSFLQDAVACSECKVQNGLQPDVQRGYWIEHFKQVREKYCQAKDVPLEYNEFRKQLEKQNPVPSGGNFKNIHDGKVIEPKSYYGSDVPEKQGAAKAAPVDNSDKGAGIPPMVDELAGQVKVPVFVAIANPSENKTEPIKPTSALFQNSTASIRPTSVVSSVPSTFLTVTSNSGGSATTSLLPASSVVPAPGTVPGPVEEHIIIIAGKPCVVYIVWIIVGCAPQTDAAGNFAIDYQTVGVDKKEPVVMLDNSEQFDKIKDAIPDGGKEEKLAEEVKQSVGTESAVVPAPGKNKDLPPVKGSTGSQPANANDEECEDVGSEGVVPVGQGSQPSSKPNHDSSIAPSKPNHDSSSAPSKPNHDSEASVPSKGGQVSGSAPSNPGTNTCECECPSTIAASSDRDATEICAKKVDTESRCNKLSGDKVKQCLCSEGEFANEHFFNEAIICARRSGDVRQSEFEAQILFETKFRFCMTENSFGNSLSAAYQSVGNDWREGKNVNDLI